MIPLIASNWYVKPWVVTEVWWTPSPTEVVRLAAAAVIDLRIEEKLVEDVEDCVTPEVFGFVKFSVSTLKMLRRTGS